MAGEVVKFCRRLFRFIRKHLLIVISRNEAKKSYSQSGEDLILHFLFRNILRLEKPTFLDIGAHDPFYLNNTFSFYLRGSRGINIEANPDLMSKFLKFRREDINLNIGIHNHTGVMKFYDMSVPTMGTFSKEEALRLQAETSIKVKRTLDISVCLLPDIISAKCGGRFPDLLNIDVEGIELDILRTIDFEKSYPKVICLETIIYEEGKRQSKRHDLFDFLKSHGYIVYADTFINTIFVKSDLLDK